MAEKKTVKKATVKKATKAPVKAPTKTKKETSKEEILLIAQKDAILSHYGPKDVVSDVNKEAIDAIDEKIKAL